MYGTRTLAFQGMDSSLLQSKFHNILATIPTTSFMFCRKIFQWITKGEDSRRRTFHNGSRSSLLCMERAYTNRKRLENDMDRIIDILANEVTVPHISFDSIHNINTRDKLVGEISLGFLVNLHL
jgi:hypothetical protein